MSKQEEIKQALELLHKGGAVPLNVVEAVNDLLAQVDEYGTLIEQQGRAMNRLQNMTNKQLLEIHRLRIELEEARKTKFPRQHDSEGGWTIDYKLLERLGVAVLRESDYSVDTEDIEQVLLALEKILGQEGEGNQDEMRHLTPKESESYERSLDKLFNQSDK